MAGPIDAMVAGLNLIEDARAKPPVPCEKCQGWIADRCEWGADWRECLEHDEADAERLSTLQEAKR